MADLKCVGALLLNPQGQLLLQQRDDRPDLIFPGYWTTLGGTVEADETPAEAMHRELLEEIELAPEMCLWKAFDNPVGKTDRVAKQYFFVGYIDLEPEAITLNEGQALGFFGPDDLEELPVGFGFKPWLKEFFQRIEDGLS